MRNYLIIVLALSLFAACGDDSDDSSSDKQAEGPLSCDWDSERLMPGSQPELPGDRQGTLAEALLGKWQHTYTVMEDDSIEPVNDTTDIRFMIAADQLAYCQHVTGSREIGPDRNLQDYTLDGDTIDLGGTTYTAINWNEDVMIWNNDTLGDQQYILQRR